MLVEKLLDSPTTYSIAASVLTAVDTASARKAGAETAGVLAALVQMSTAREALKEKLLADPSFKDELKQKVKEAILGKAQPKKIEYNFDSYMLTEVQPGQLRLLEVDERLVVPTNTLIRFLITSSDVIHSWAVPALGIKCDAVPGRLNQVWCTIQRPGVFYGQCSELCGANHAFMPIVVEAVTPRQFLTDYVKKWIS